MKVTDASVTRFADMFAALGSEPRLRIVRLLLSAHPEGMVVSEIQAETGIAGSTLSHHLEKLKIDELVTTEREKAFIRYRANADALEELLGFLVRGVLHAKQGRRFEARRGAFGRRRTPPESSKKQPPGGSGRISMKGRMTRAATLGGDVCPGGACSTPAVCGRSRRGDKRRGDRPQPRVISLW